MIPSLRISDEMTPNPRSTRLALSSLSLSTLMSSMGISIVTTGLPTLASAFSATFVQVQWLMLAYLLAITGLVVVAGRLGDLVGRRRLLLGGIVLFTLASLLCGLAPSLALLIVARLGQGMAAAILMALGAALIGGTVAPEKTGGAMGLLGSMSALGTMLGPALGGVLITGLGWRAIFLIQLPLGLLAFVWAWRHLPPDATTAHDERQRFDVPGTVLLSTALAACALALTLGRNGFGALNILLLSLAGTALFVFLRVEARSAWPLLPPTLLREPALRAGLAANIFVSAVIMATLVVGPFHLSRVFGLDTAGVGLALSVGPLVSALVGVPAGRLVDRFASQALGRAGLAVMLTGLAALAGLPASLGLFSYVAPLVLVTAGYALFQAANNTAIMGKAQAGRRGLISGLLSLSRYLGLSSGACGFGTLFAWSIGGDPATAAVGDGAQATRFTFAVAALTVVAAFVMTSRARHAGERGRA